MGGSEGGTYGGFEEFGRRLAAARAVPISHALDQFLDAMEARISSGVEHGLDPDLEDVLPLGTGLEPLDRVLRGGLGRGEVTLVDADIPAQATALLNTVSRGTPHARLIDAGDLGDLMVGLMASSSGVPGVAVHDARLSSSEWRSLAEGVGRLSEQEMHVCSAGSLNALAATASEVDVDVVVIHGPRRMGPLAEVLPNLVRFAHDLDVAVLTAAGPTNDLPAWVFEDVVKVEMVAYDLGGRATLLCPDSEEMLIAARVDVECLAGIVR